MTATSSTRGYVEGGGASSFQARLVGLLVFIAVLMIHSSKAQGTGCPADCSFGEICNGTVCICDAGFTLHSDGKTCRNESCSSPDCLQCDSPNFCSVCISFIEKSTGECFKTCEGSAEKVNGSFVCTASEDGDDDDEIIIIAVIAGVAVGAVLCIIIIIIVCIYIRKTRRNINLQNHIYSGRHMDSGNVKKFAVYDNNAYVGNRLTGEVTYSVPHVTKNDTPGLDYRLGKKLDPLEYQTELERLRPHMDTLMTILSETRSKTRAMKETDPRQPTYKGVIHQLCRVLVLLHKKDPVHSLPSDALSLVQWGHQMVEDARQQEMPASDPTLDFPTAQISSVDMEDNTPNPTSPVYATPGGSVDMGITLPFNAQATPYHSVPVVPYAQSQFEVTNAAPPEGQNYQSASRKPGFATISRTPSIPNGTILQNLEFSQSQPSDRAAAVADNRSMQAQIEASSSSPPHQASYYPATTPSTVEPDVIPQPVKRLTKEDFRSLLISNRASPTATAQNRVSVVDDLDGETVITGGSWDAEVDNKLATANQNNTTHEEGHFNTFGRSNKLSRMYSDNDANNSPPVLRGNKNIAGSSRPVSTPNIKYVFATPPASGDGGSPAIHRNTSTPGLGSRSVSQTYSVPHKPPKPQPPPKKNIITNSLLGKKSKQAANTNPATTNATTPHASTGYFANGHFYDPNPMPGNVVEGEVYAPGSNYSDRSNAMSTFLGDMPRSRSVSTSNNSEGNDSENSGGDLDVFPFDPNEATDPVEV